MFDYLLKFNKLPQELRDRISTPTVMSAINDLEERYRVNLATVVMKIMVGEILFDDILAYFVEEFNLDNFSAAQLRFELAQKVFAPAADYLGLDLETIEPPAKEENLQPVETAGQEAGAADKSLAPDKVAPVRGSSFFFSPEDEEEIRRLSQKVEGLELKNLSQEQLERKIEKILAETEINFGSEDLKERFKQILKTYLRGIRKKTDTKFSLTKPFSEGGLDFDEESAEKVLAIANKVYQEKISAKPTAPPPKMKLPEDEQDKDKLSSLKSIGVRDIEYDLAKELKRAGKPESQGEKTTYQKEKPLTGLPALKTKDAASRQPDADIVMSDKTKPRLSVDRGGKVRMDDVKFVPKTSGPIDELKYLDLTSFRRLDKDPLKAATKIKGKIELLESEQYSKRLEAIKAWRQNPINKLYLEIGEVAINNKKPIDIIIEERRAAGQAYLNSQEFEAIMNLNKELRF